MHRYGCFRASQVALMVKNPPANAEDLRDLRSGFDSWVGKIPGEGMATHSSILTWRIPWTEEPGGLQSTGFQTVRHNLAHMHRAVSFGCAAETNTTL